MMFSPLSSSRPARTIKNAVTVSRKHTARKRAREGREGARRTEALAVARLLRLGVLDVDLLSVVEDDVHELVEALRARRARGQCYGS